MPTNAENTIGYYMSCGFSEEVARTLAGGSVDRVPSYPKLLIVTDDAYPEIGIPKGTFVSGYEYDKKSFSFTKEGINLGKNIDAIILATAYQFSKYDGVSGNSFATPIFKNPYDAKKMRDKKTGMTKDEAKAKGINPSFNQILLTLVKVNGAYTPFLIYLSNTRRFKFLDRLKELGLAQYTANDRLKLTSKKVGSGIDGSGLPSTIYHVESVNRVQPNDNISIHPLIEEAITNWNAWIKASAEVDVEESATHQHDDNPFD